jgi:hypothetical protein
VVAENTGRFIYVATDLQVTIETFQVAANGVLSVRYLVSESRI